MWCAGRVNKMETLNATITSAFLGFGEREWCWILSFDLVNGYCQCFSSNLYESRHLIKIMQCAGVESWSDLKGQSVRVVRKNDMIIGIGHVVKDFWFYL